MHGCLITQRRPRKTWHRWPERGGDSLWVFRWFGFGCYFWLSCEPLSRPWLSEAVSQAVSKSNGSRSRQSSQSVRQQVSLSVGQLMLQRDHKSVISVSAYDRDKHSWFIGRMYDTSEVLYLSL